MLRRNDGMTLVELLIAVAIAGILVTITYTLMNAQTHAINNSRNTSEMEDNVRVAMDALARDIRNSGYLLPDLSYAVRVENNCGASPTGGAPSGGASVTGSSFSVPGSNAISVDGQVVGDSQADGCPNGSDRITLVTRPTNAYVLGAAGGGSFPTWPVSCNPPNVVGGNCTNIVQFGGIPGGTCNCNPATPGSCTSSYGNVCNNNDPFSCSLVTVDYSNCVSSVGVCALAPTCNLIVSSVSTNPGSGNPPELSTPATEVNATLQQFASRTYQLMDLDGDGTTELVFSDDVNGKLENGTATAAIWNPVANYIDDLQFSFAYSANPTVFVSGSLWNLNAAGSLGCTEAGPTANEYCLNADLAGTGIALAAGTGSNPPIAIRVTVVGRPQKKEISVASQAALFLRGQVEDNFPTAQAFNLVTLPNNGPANCYGGEGAGTLQNCGCGPSGTTGGAATNPQSYLTCTGNGNAQGFRRRVLTEIIALRNLTGNL